jgi:2-polyprenyl-3-methyl-5-hydroxy-6-metoxy-1,4-benzoquinol methylase
MRRIKIQNINTQEYWNTFATEEYTQKDISRGGSICKFNTIHDILPQNANILDIGCLNGNLYNFLNSKNFLIKHFTGVDLSDKLIELAKRRFPTQTWVQADRLHLPFEDKLFDVVTLLETLEHVDNPRETLKEAIRMCKDNGILIVSVPNELRIEDPAHVWSFTTEDLFNLLSEFSTNVQILQTCSNNRNIIGKAIINYTKYE